MIKEALDFLKQNFRSAETKTINGREFTLDKWNLVPNKFSEPEPSTITVNTLTGLVDFLNAEKDIKDNAIIHVVNEAVVRVISDLYGDNLQRKVWVEAKTDKTIQQGFRFNSFMDIPLFIINLQAYFVKTDSLDVILEFASSIKSEQSQEFNDSGVSQSVVAKRSAGSTIVDRVSVPNPISLRPFRTFLEVEQPEASFVFRISTGTEGSSPMLALFDASGGAWKLEAALNIKEWLLKKDITFPVVA